MSKAVGEELAAGWTNRFFVVTTPQNMRIAFAEIVPGGSGEEHVRAAVMMSLDDAAELADLIQRQIAQVRSSTGAGVAKH